MFVENKLVNTVIMVAKSVLVVEHFLDDLFRASKLFRREIQNYLLCTAFGTFHTNATQSLFLIIGTVTFTNVPKVADVKLRSKPAKIVNFADFKLAKMPE